MSVFDFVFRRRDRLSKVKEQEARFERNLTELSFKHKELDSLLVRLRNIQKTFEKSRASLTSCTDGDYEGQP